MDVREAVRLAKQHVAETFEDEPIFDIGLEEVEWDASDHAWAITIGFARAWKENVSLVTKLTPPSRVYKVIRIDGDDGEVRSIRHRNIASGP